MNKIDEKELKKLFTELKSSNNRIAFETLYTKYNKLVYRIAFTILKNKEDSEDIMQAVFSKIYTLSKDKLPIDNIPTWIYSVTKNESISLFRKKKNTVNIESVYEIADTDNEKRVSKKSNFKNDFYFCLSSGERSFPQKFCLALGKASKVWSNAPRF